MNEWYDKYWEATPAMKKDNIILGGFFAAYDERYSSWYR
jgi:hypothetical protein